MIIVDSKAAPRQRKALVEFASEHARHAGQIVKVVTAPMDMTVDHFAAIAHLNAGSLARIETRKIGNGDCVCSNETAFYPPLAEVKNAVPAYTVDGGFSGPGLGTHWSVTRSMG